MNAGPPDLLGVVGTWLAGASRHLSTDSGPGDPSPSLRVGIDLVSVADVVASVERFGHRYVHRIFTPHEVSCCRSGDVDGGMNPRYSFESLAARFAAKEAVLKVLRPVDAQPEWRSIEVHRAPDGWCEIRLTGQAESMRVQAGIDELAVSLTHHASMAAAVVVGWCHRGGRDLPPEFTALTERYSVGAERFDHG
jgi:holo-[acyl-carrier protein] synthase